MQDSAQRKAPKAAKWEPPRGVRLLPPDPACVNRPYGVQWRVDGKRKTKNFATAEQRETFARSLVGAVRKLGVDAYRLDPSEARAWRAFRAELGEASLDDVLRCWRRHGAPNQSALTVAKAAEAFLAAKKAEGVAETSLGHYGPILDRFCATFGPERAASITREQIGAWLGKLTGADHTRRTHFVRVRSMFRWLQVNRHIPESPCDGLKPLKITPDEVEVLTPAQTADLFAANAGDRELCGRLALEAFCGLRFSSAAQVVSADIDFAARGITLPAAKIKTRRRQYIDGLPDNLWLWLEWSDPEAWTFTGRQYMQAKSMAFVRARVPHPHNALRHSFASYHVALHKDASRTAAILCHTTPKTLYAHYKGRATAADGAAYFAIKPAAK